MTLICKVRHGDSVTIHILTIIEVGMTQINTQDSLKHGVKVSMETFDNAMNRSGIPNNWLIYCSLSMYIIMIKTFGLLGKTDPRKKNNKNCSKLNFDGSCMAS